MFRDGQWVCFESNLPTVARTRKGKAVGLHHKARTARLGDKIVPVPAQIVPVDEHGLSIPLGPGTFEALQHLTYAAHEVRQLEPILDRADIPAGRLKGVPESWQPRP